MSFSVVSCRDHNWMQARDYCRRTGHIFVNLPRFSYQSLFYSIVDNGVTDNTWFDCASIHRNKIIEPIARPRRQNRGIGLVAWPSYLCTKRKVNWNAACLFKTWKFFRSQPWNWIDWRFPPTWCFTNSNKCNYQSALNSIAEWCEMKTEIYFYLNNIWILFFRFRSFCAPVYKLMLYIDICIICSIIIIICHKYEKETTL